MTDDEWKEAVVETLASRRRDPDGTIAKLSSLSRQATASERKFAGTWHATQALGVAAVILSESGRHREAASIFKRVAKLHEAVLRQHGHGLGSALAAASLELFKAGQPEPATRLAWESLRHFGTFPDPSSVHEQVIRELRAHLNKKARRGSRHAG